METGPPQTPRTRPYEATLRRMWSGVSRYLNDVRRFTPNVRLYLTGSFLMGFNFQVFNLLFNLYLKEVGFPEGQIGQVASARAVGMTLMAVPAAIILSRLRLKRVLLVTVSLFALFSFLLVRTHEHALMLGCSVFAGMAFSFYRVAAAPFFMRHSTPVERTHIFSFSFGMMILAGMIGSLVAGKTAASIGDYLGDIVAGYRYTLYLGIGLGLAALIPFLLIRAADPSRDENRITLSVDQLRRRGRFYFKVTIANFIIGAGAGLIIPFLPLYFRDRFHLAPDTIGLYYFFVSCSMLAGMIVGPVLARRFSLVRTVVFTQLASIPFMLVLSYSFVLPLATLAFVVRGGLMNLGVPIVSNLAMELSDDRERGLVNALLMIAWTGSWMISSALGGYFIEHYGYTLTMNITIGLYITSSFVFYFFFKGVERQSQGGRRWEILKDGFD